jgi:superfamily II DNA or RNA helicase
MPHPSDPAAPSLTYDFDPARALLQPRPYQLQLIQDLYDKTRTARPGGRFFIEVATGGGKNLISNNCIVAHVADGKRILCVTMGWTPSHQAAADLCNRYSGARAAISYVGSGAGSRAMGGLQKGADGVVVFTTIQSWNARKASDFAGKVFDVVVIDELHWGEEAPLYEALYKTYRDQAAFVGLTATPRRWTQYERVGRSYDLATLVSMGYLAEPRLQTVLTGVNWLPRRTNEHGDVTPTSLRELATSEERNSLIVSTYVARAREYGKSIVFACNIEHAEALASHFVALGVRAAAVHSNMKDIHRLHVVESFRRGDLEVLVNVVSAVHGLDVPDITTVMLARPTASDILMTQMIGRGTRLAPGKTFFHLVDFVDNASVHGGAVLVRPDGFLGSRLGPGARGEAIFTHVYEAASLAPFPAIEEYAELTGLLVQREQTFGIEFELTSPDFGACTPSTLRWRTVAGQLLEALRAGKLPTAPTFSTSGHTFGKDHTVWNVEYDASCGWEITSRILRGFEGFIEVADACRVIQQAAAKCGLSVSVRTGTHVHLGWSKCAAPIHRLFEVAAYFEPALLSLVAPSRANSRYAMSVRRVFKQVRSFATEAEWARFLSCRETRYLAVNPRGLFYGLGTVEIRLHSGTIEAPKILTWLSLWMTILAAAQEGRVVPGDPGQRLYRAPLCPGPRGDVVELAAYVGASAALLERLVARRAYVVSRSWTRAENPRHQELAHRLLRVWQPSQATSEVGTAVAAE